MATIVGNGEYRYRIVENWAKLPDGWSFKEVAAVGVDSGDNVYVFNRGEHPMMVFDRQGNFLRSWGEGQYPRAHGVHMGPDESVYLTDNGLRAAKSLAARYFIDRRFDRVFLDRLKLFIVTMIVADQGVDHSDGAIRDRFRNPSADRHLGEFVLDGAEA